MAPVDEVAHNAVCVAKVVPCPAADVGCEHTCPRGVLSQHTATCTILPLRTILLNQQNMQLQLKETQQQLIQTQQELAQVQQVLHKIYYIPQERQEKERLEREAKERQVESYHLEQEKIKLQKDLAAIQSQKVPICSLFHELTPLS